MIQVTTRRLSGLLISAAPVPCASSHRRGMASKQADRTKGITPSVWVEFTKLAIDNQAVNIGQGFPDYAPPDYIIKALTDVASNPQTTHLYQYTRPFGHRPLVDQLAKVYATFGLTVDPLEEVLVTVGAYLALYYAISGYVNHGDEVIVMEPAYDCYDSQIRIAGGTPVYVAMKLTDPSKENLTTADFKVDFAELESKITPKAKLIVLNNPHNPTGKLYTKEELTTLADIAKRHDLLVISDEVYEWLVYPPAEMVRFATLPGMWERTITIGSGGKVFSSTGLKTGWAVGPAKLLWPLKCVHQNCIFNCPTVTQDVIAKGFELELSRLGSKECYFNSISAELKPKRDKMARFLREAGMRPILPEAGYFMLADFSNIDWPIDSQPTFDMDDYKFVRWLCNEKKLAGIPTSAFYGPDSKHLGKNFIRFCFFKKDETLNAAEKIIQELAKKN